MSAHISPQDITQRALSEGFVSCGFASPHIPERNQARFDAFIAGEEYGTMTWMAARAAQRRDPAALWPEVRSVISLGYSYAPEADPMARLAMDDLANISTYAWGRDYHDIVKKAAKRLGRWMCETTAQEIKVFVDTAPVLEKPLAQQAGIGWQGKHTNLVSKSHGSWLFLAEIYTTLELEPTGAQGDHCGSCTRCLTACPTAALPAPYQLETKRCLAYLSIEHEGPIPHEFRVAMGNRIYGCDDCLAVCPWNKFANQSQELRFCADQTRDLSLKQALRMDEPAFRAFFSGSPIKRIKWHRWIRNALICAGNADGQTWPTLAPLVQGFIGHEDATLDEAARWAQAQQGLTGR